MDFTGNEIVYSVTQVTQTIKNLLEESFPTITLEGEISNYRPNSTGHLYFTLKDENSQISAVMFASSARSLTFNVADGKKVRCRGRITVYPARGNYQILITSMEPAGEGEILLMLEQRKQKLAAQGLFDSSRKRPLSQFPKTIGVVTTPSGAGLRDILQIIRRRNPCVNIVILPAIVQGADAAPTIIRQIENANTYHLCDTLIVGRGGGSLEDLLPFSEEAVVRAVAESQIPVISAVGHEIDWALCDYAADVRAPTPSAAAELATSVKDEIIDYLQNKQNLFYSEIRAKVDQIKLMVKSFSPDNLELNFRQIEQPLLQQFDDLKDDLLRGMEERLKDTRIHIEKMQSILKASDPHLILDKGFSMVRDKKTGKLIRSGSDASPGTELEIIPAKGKITAQVITAE